MQGTIVNKMTYEDVYQNIVSVFPQKQNNMILDGLVGGVTNEKLADSTTTSANSYNGVSGTDYSDTNLQVLGVQETDIIKTDGKNIYAYGKNTLYID